MKALVFTLLFLSISTSYASTTDEREWGEPQAKTTGSNQTVTEASAKMWEAFNSGKNNLSETACLAYKGSENEMCLLGQKARKLANQVISDESSDIGDCSPRPERICRQLKKLVLSDFG